MKKFFLIAAACIGIGLTDTMAQPFSAGGGHSIFLCQGQKPKACGGNTARQLGISANGNNHLVPSHTDSIVSNIVNVSAGNAFTLFVRSDGRVIVCGSHEKGQLGVGLPLTVSHFPSVNPTLTDVVQASAGYRHSLFLKSDGTVWACGGNNAGQLGIGNTTDKSVPVEIPGLTNVVAVGAGNNFSLFLKSDGSVWGCGDNSAGQLVTGSTTSSLSPVRSPYLSNISAMSVGAFHALFIRNNGTVLGCGNNTRGELGLGFNAAQYVTTPVVPGGSMTNTAAVSAGASFSLFLQNDGTVLVTGANDVGQLGLGNTIDRNTPITHPSLTGISAIEAGTGYSLFLKNNNTFWGTGTNGAGQLGNGTATSTLTPVQTSLPLETVTNPANSNACSGAPVNLLLTAGSPNSDFIWTAQDNPLVTGESLTPQSGNRITDVLVNNSSVAQPVSYTVTPSSCFAGTSRTLTVMVYPKRPISASGGGTYCIGDTVSLTASNGFVRYDWRGPAGFVQNNVQNPVMNYIQPQAGGWYTVTGTDSLGCKSSDSTLLTMRFIGITASYNGPVCTGDSIRLSADCPECVRFDWLFPGNQRQFDIQNPVVYPAGFNNSGQYTVIGTDSTGCWGGALVDVTVRSGPVAPQISRTADRLTLSNVFTAVSFQWYKNNVSIPGATANFYDPTETGTYAVVVADSNGCEARSPNFFFTPSSPSNASVNEYTDNGAGIYPNPTDGQFRLLFPQSGTENLRFRLHDRLGRVLQDREIPFNATGTYELDITALPAGLYTVSASNGALQRSFTVVKNR